MLAILINKSNLSLIAVLNEGVEPLIEEKPTYFIYYGEKYNAIVSETLFRKAFEIGWENNEGIYAVRPRK